MGFRPYSFESLSECRRTPQVLLEIRRNQPSELVFIVEVQFDGQKILSILN